MLHKCIEIKCECCQSDLSKEQVWRVQIQDFCCMKILCCKCSKCQRAWWEMCWKWLWNQMLIDNELLNFIPVKVFAIKFANWNSWKFVSYMNMYIHVYFLYINIIYHTCFYLRIIMLRIFLVIFKFDEIKILQQRIHNYALVFVISFLNYME